MRYLTAAFLLALTGCASAQVATKHVATNAALQATATASAPEGLWRDDYATGKGASPLWFTPLVGTCAANSLVNDGGYCVNTAAGDGNSWRAWHGPEGVSVIQFGADRTGAADSAAATNAALKPGNVTVLTPCGTYLHNSSVFMPDHTKWLGAGPCTTIVLPTNAADNPQIVNAYGTIYQKIGFSTIQTIVSNADFNAINTDIEVGNMYWDSSALGRTHIGWGAFFYNAEHISMHDVRMKGAGNTNLDGDIAAFIGGGFINFANNEYFNYGGEGCVDGWYGFHDFVWSNNRCLPAPGGPGNQRGFTVNGVSSSAGAPEHPPLPTQAYNGVLKGNIVKNAKNDCYLILGLKAGPVVGSLKNIVVDGNVCDGATGYYGFWIGDGENITVSNNVASDVASSCYYVDSDDAAAPTERVTLTGNVCDRASLVGGPWPAIKIGPTATAIDRVTIAGNAVTGTAHSYALRLYPDVTNAVVGVNNLEPGVSGDLLDQGAGTSIVGVNTSTYFDYAEIATPPAPPANTARIYANDNGSGKTRLMVRFPTGAVQQLAIEP